MSKPTGASCRCSMLLPSCLSSIPSSALCTCRPALLSLFSCFSFLEMIPSPSSGQWLLSCSSTARLISTQEYKSVHLLQVLTFWTFIFSWDFWHLSLFVIRINQIWTKSIRLEPWIDKMNLFKNYSIQSSILFEGYTCALVYLLTGFWTRKIFLDKTCKAHSCWLYFSTDFAKDSRSSQTPQRIALILS